MANPLLDNVGIQPELSKILAQPAQADTAGGATLAQIIADHNALLAKLRAAGIIST
jgi:hypothetical protein